MDSLDFLPSSLEKLTESLIKTKERKNQKMNMLYKSEIVQKMMRNIRFY